MATIKEQFDSIPKGVQGRILTKMKKAQQLLNEAANLAEAAGSEFWTEPSGASVLIDDTFQALDE